MPRLKRFACEGMQLQMPQDWDPVALEATEDEGLVRIEDAEKRERLTLKWSLIRGRFNLDRNFRKLEKSLQRSLRQKARSGHEVHFEAPATIPKASKALRNNVARTYAWKDDEGSGWGAMVYVPQTDRASILQFIGQGRQDEALAGEVLASYRDAPAGQSWRWEMHGVTLDVPTQWRLRKARYDPRGVFRLDLGAGRRRALSAVRWSLANLLLAGKSLKDFLASAHKKEAKQYNLYFEPFKLGGFEAVRFERARPKRWAAHLLRLLRPSRAYYLHGLAWHNPETNRIHVMAMTGDNPDGMAELRDIVATAGDFRGRPAPVDEESTS